MTHYDTKDNIQTYGNRVTNDFCIPEFKGISNKSILQFCEELLPVK